MNDLLACLTIAAALGSGLVAGFFFAFSFVIMKSLGRLAAELGISAMQSINVVVLNAWFFTAFFGTAAICLILGGYALFNLDLPEAPCLLIGSALYLSGVIVVTMAANVPLNNRLAAASPRGDEGARTWTHYLSEWTRWNHVRTAAPLLAALAFILALR